MSTLSIPPQAYTRETLAQAYSWLKSQPETIKDRAKNADALVSLYLHATRHGLDVFKENATDADNDAPRSSQNFKNTLKNLTEGFKQFEAASTPDPVTQQVPNNVSPIHPQHSYNSVGTGAKNPSTLNQVQNRDRESLTDHQPITPTHAPPPPQTQSPMGNQQHPQETQVRVSRSHPNSSHAHPSRHHDQDPFPVYRSYIAEDEWAQSGTAVSLEAPFPPFANAATELSLDSRSHEVLRRVRRKMNLSSENEALRMLLSLGFERLRDIVP